MKLIRLCSLLLAVLLLPLAALANVGQVTTLSTSTPKTIVVPGPRCTFVRIENNGSAAVRYSVDGGSTYTDPYTGKVGTDPTATTGGTLAAGQFIMFTINPGSNYILPIRAIMATGTTTLDIITNDFSPVAQEFPTS